MKIDMEAWERKEIYTFFSAVSNPFYMTTFTVDVTEAYLYAKQHDLSFYYTLIHLCCEALNRVEAFHYTIRDHEIHYIAQRHPSFTDMKKGRELFHIVTLPWEASIADFCKKAAQQSKQQTVFIEKEKESDELVYFSCLPWIEMTALTNERNMDPEDAVPHIAWGKYVEAHGRKKLQISVDVNHRFIDGYHIGRFYEELVGLIRGLYPSAC